MIDTPQKLQADSEGAKMGGGLMEREIANVAAASAMRGFRYMAFPPIVFDQPGARLRAPIPASLPREAVIDEAASAATQIAAASEVTATYLPAGAPAIPAAASRAGPRPDIGADTQRAAPAASAVVPIQPPATPDAQRSFALLDDVSAEIGRQAAR